MVGTAKLSAAKAIVRADPWVLDGDLQWLTVVSIIQKMPVFNHIINIELYNHRKRNTHGYH